MASGLFGVEDILLSEICGDQDTCLEVNIYENPELLEVSDDKREPAWSGTVGIFEGLGRLACQPAQKPFTLLNCPTMTFGSMDARKSATLNPRFEITPNTAYL